MDMILLEDDCGNGSDIENGLKKQIKEDKLYVAVGKDFKENESVLCWAIQNSGGSLISIIHVHKPDNFIPILGEKYHWSSLNEQQVKAYRGIEKQFMLKSLDEYLHFCHEFGVQAEKLYIEMDSIEKGILQLIAQHSIEKLVMGAASDGCYHTKMVEPMSQKSVFVQQRAPAKCHIWFICKGNLIHQRKSNSQSKHTPIGRSINLNPLPMVGQGSKCELRNEDLLLGEGSSHYGNGRVHEIPSMDNIENTHVSWAISDLEEADCNSMSDVLQMVRSFDPSVSTSHTSRESTLNQLQLHTAPFFEDNQYHHLSSPCTVSQAKLSEDAYAQVVKKRKELEEELERVKNDRDKLSEELQDAMDDNLVLEARVANYEQVVKELEEGIISNVEMLQCCEQERDGLKIERDNVLKTAEELLNQSAEASSRTVAPPKFFATFTFAEIEKATNDFDPSLQVWEGEDGSIYEGVLSHTQVTIKMWHPDGPEGPQDFHQEVETLSKFRHPNVATLIGICPEAYAVIYEYLSNGTLQERLNSRGDAPLPWKTRIKIGTELCCALIFLHSQVPKRVIHGSLKPSSIFLDSNFSCKIRDFGFARIISHDENSHSAELPCSSSYTDPQYFVTGVAAPSSDVYSFGLILLELLTGKPAFGVTYEMEDALEENSFNSFLDTLAGEWPFVQAEQLARMALRCCSEDVSDRPDLEEVWRVLEPMRTSCGGSTSNHVGDEENRQAPSYFMCPIFQEVMKDPHVAADGYTYEAEALQGWLDTGHDTSPMTNLQLEHTTLVPNHALRSAIQEWRQRH